MSWIINEAWAIIALIPVFILIYSLKILREYERGVVFVLGRFWKVKGPGLIIIVPIIQQMVRVDLRIRVLDVPEHDVISRDKTVGVFGAIACRELVDHRPNLIDCLLIRHRTPPSTENQAHCLPW